MGKVKCYSVRLQTLYSVSPRAMKAIAYDGSTAIIPKSQVYGQDYDVLKSDAYWISAWILEQKELQYSSHKVAWFDSDTGKMLPTYIVKKHIPLEVSPVDDNSINDLSR